MMNWLNQTVGVLVLELELALFWTLLSIALLSYAGSPNNRRRAGIIRWVHRFICKTKRKPSKIQAKHTNALDCTGGGRLRRLPPVWLIKLVRLIWIFLCFLSVLRTNVCLLWIFQRLLRLLGLAEYTHSIG